MNLKWIKSKKQKPPKFVLVLMCTDTASIFVGFRDIYGRYMLNTPNDTGSDLNELNTPKYWAYIPTPKGAKINSKNELN